MSTPVAIEKICRPIPIYSAGFDQCWLYVVFVFMNDPVSVPISLCGVRYRSIRQPYGKRLLGPECNRPTGGRLGGVDVALGGELEWVEPRQPIRSNALLTECSDLSLASFGAAVIANCRCRGGVGTLKGTFGFSHPSQGIRFPPAETVE